MNLPSCIRLLRLGIPEITVEEDTDLEQLLTPYEDKTIGILKYCQASVDRPYYQGKVIIDDAKEYYVEFEENRVVPVEMGDGLFLENIPSGQFEWYAKPPWPKI